ncbi:MAG: RagB/SusD family nutrient uptake outer membrane protein [Sphingobacteriales bacterium]|nr:RagB/SusD family nutrient uptake outer membrane protein [Sphingobacteriales bacterium]
MKSFKIFGFSAMILGLFLLSSCEKFLDLEPEDRISVEEALNSLGGLDSAMTGAFDRFQSSGQMFSGGLLSNGELLSDNVYTDAISDFGLAQLRAREMVTFNGESTNLWNDGYNLIHRCNTVLAYMKNVSMGDADKVRLEAEARFLRGVTYFELVKHFGQPWGSSKYPELGVPLMTEPGSTTNGTNIARSSVAAVYDFAIADLTYAAQNLSPDSRRASKQAAQAFLARIYLQQSNYAAAAEQAAAVVNSGKYTLATDLMEVFNSENGVLHPEVVFAIINRTGDNNNSIRGRYRKNSDLFKMSTDFMALLNADVAEGSNRGAMYVTEGIETFTTKWDNNKISIPVIRYAEMLLTLAECAAKNGDEATARTHLNTVRQRAGLADMNVSGEDLINAIYKERALELAFEGDRIHFLKRLQRDIKSGSTGEVAAWNADNLVYPIPQGDMDANDAMQQNPGYE